MQRAAWAWIGLCLLSACGNAVAGDEKYRAEIEGFRQKRETGLKAEDGWLSVSGLFWLRPGETRMGSDPSNDILLPDHAPAFVGVLTLSDTNATFKVAPGVAITRAGKQFNGGELHSDKSGPADVLAVGDLKLILIKRGDRHAIRLKDNRSPQRTSFAGLRWFPIKEDWRITAKFVKYPAPKKLMMDTIVGISEEADCPGYVTFERDGKTFTLEPAVEKNGMLWFVFRDRTSGRTTAGGARQLYADAPVGDVVILDFNRATNLPCSYIPYATCPLAPPQNRLALAIEAGEKKYEPRSLERAAARATETAR
jgi:uncharacterized protein (DUF1684 family)